MLRILSVRDTRLATWDSGEGATWLFIHGFPLDHSMWRFQLDNAPPDLRIIAPDLRGFGRSLLGERELLTMDGFADDLADLLDGLGVDEPVTVCGLSMGGYVAFEFWSRHRDRLKQLILCDTRAAADDEATRRARELTALRVLQEGTAFLAETMGEKLFSESTRRNHPYRVQALMEVMRQADPQAVAGALRGMAQRTDFTQRLSEIDVPVTLVCGDADSVTPPQEMEAMAAQIPGAQFHLIQGAGHLAPYECPAEVNGILFEQT